MLRFLQKISILSLAVFALHVQAATIKTRSLKANHFVSDDPSMRAWLKKMPQIFKGIPVHSKKIKITNVDVQWKQTKVVRKIATSKKKKAKSRSSYVCELHFTVQYQDSISGEEAPSLTARPRPMRVNSRCDSYFAKSDILSGTPRG